MRIKLIHTSIANKLTNGMEWNIVSIECEVIWDEEATTNYFHTQQRNEQTQQQKKLTSNKNNNGSHESRTKTKWQHTKFNREKETSEKLYTQTYVQFCKNFFFRFVVVNVDVYISVSRICIIIIIELPRINVCRKNCHEPRNKQANFIMLCIFKYIDAVLLLLVILPFVFDSNWEYVVPFNFLIANHSRRTISSVYDQKLWILLGAV